MQKIDPIKEHRMNDFTNRLNVLMRDKTQTEVSKATGIAQQTLSRYQQGLCRPGIDRLLALCRYFRVSSDYLLGLKDEDGGNE